MEVGEENQVDGISSMPASSVGRMQIEGSSIFAEVDMEEGTLNIKRDRPLPIYLKFEDVRYKVRISHAASPINMVKAMASRVSLSVHPNKDQDNYKNILNGITGSVDPGEILALMGPSGSGKTTLLRVIGGRLPDNAVGTVTFNDVPYTPALKRRIGFVTQYDVLFPQLTVEETLTFTAFLRLPSHLSRKQKHGKVDKVIEELGLESCRKTSVGGTFTKGISGGERKRTSIGHEILVDPSLLLLDEPTSGLDSTSANRILQTLQGLAKAGRTIITTIHQPSSRMFHMFDKLLLISEGHPIFYGRTRDSLSYFSSMRFIPQIAMNPAEFLLDLATGQVNDISIPEDIFTTRASTYPENAVIKYLQLKYSAQLEPGERANQRAIKAPEHLQKAIQVKKDWTMTWWEQFRILSKRTFKERCTDYFDILRLIQALGVALLLGMLWWNSKSSTEAQLRDQVGLMYYICIFWTSLSLFGAVYVFPFEKEYLVKERKTDMYRMSVYYTCSTLCDMVAHVSYPASFMVIIYFMAGFKRTFECFSLTVLAIILVAITSEGAGELFGAIVMNVKSAGMAASLLLMLFLLTGGYYVQHIPGFMVWLKYLSFMYHGFRLLLKVQYSGNDQYECQSPGGCRPLQSSPSFDTVNLDGGLQEVWILLAMAIGYRISAYACLRWKINKSAM